MGEGVKDVQRGGGTNLSPPHFHPRFPPSYLIMWDFLPEVSLLSEADLGKDSNQELVYVVVYPWKLEIT